MLLTFTHTLRAHTGTVLPSVTPTDLGLTSQDLELSTVPTGVYQSNLKDEIKFVVFKSTSFNFSLY